MRRAVLWLSVLATACVSFDEIDEYPCPDGGTTLSYTNFGKPFLDDWCNSCHSAPFEGRHGAPEEVRFDSPSDVQRWKDRIFVRAALGNDSMPPGPNDPSGADRQRLAEWLSCGAP